MVKQAYEQCIKLQKNIKLIITENSREKSKITSSFGYVGAKRQLTEEIIKLIPPHRLFVEGFGGSLATLYAKPKNMFTIKKDGRSQAYAEIVNDINGELINLHKVIQKYPQTLAYYLNQMLVSRELFYDIKLSKLKPRNNIERAAFYYYLLSQSFGSKGKNFAMNAKSRKPKNIYRDFSIYSERLKLVTIENMSFEKLIKIYDNPLTFFYLDPPYVGTEGHYSNIDTFGIKQHKLLANLLSNIEGKFLLSYNDCDLVRELYKDFNILQTKEIKYTLSGSKKPKKVKEVFITNY